MKLKRWFWIQKIFLQGNDSEYVCKKEIFQSSSSIHGFVSEKECRYNFKHPHEEWKKLQNTHTYAAFGGKEISIFNLITQDCENEEKCNVKISKISNHIDNDWIMDLRYLKLIKVQFDKITIAREVLIMIHEVIFFRMMNHEKMSSKDDSKDCKTPKKPSLSVFGICLITLSAHNRVLWYQGV